MIKRDQWICLQNIDNFRTLHAAARDEKERAKLTLLLELEEEKLRQLSFEARDGAKYGEKQSGFSHVEIDGESRQNGERARRGKYSCYFFGRAVASSFGAPSSIEAEHELNAETDDEARIAAEILYRQRHTQTYGYEVWEADRLVQRQPNALAGSEVRSQPPGDASAK